MRKALRAVLISFLITFSLGFYFTNRLIYMKKKDEQFILKREKEAGRYNPEHFESLPKREVIIDSPLAIPLKLCW